MKISILGPSHAKQLDESRRNGTLRCPQGYFIKGIQSCPIFSEYMIEEVASRAKQSDYVYLYSPSSMRFNFLHEKMTERYLVSRTQHDSCFNQNPYLFETELLKDLSVVSTMDAHLRKWLEWYIAEFSNLSFIFWCHFVSEKKSEHSESGSQRDNYTSLASDYRCLDLEAFLSFTGRNYLDILKTNQSHKNLYGQQKLIEFIHSLHS